MRRYLIYLVTFLFFSCEKEELAILPHLPGNILSKEIELGIDYRNQVFYDLGSNSVMSNNLKTDWDLGFQSSNDGFHIILNSSTYSSLAHVDNSLFSDSISTSNLSWTWDNPSGNLDSTAFGDYREKSGFFVIDRGYNINASLRGFKKISIDSITSEFYQISYANLDNSDFNSVKVFKNPQVNFTSFSFSQNDVVNIQPLTDDWDLIFTQYTHLFDDPTTPAYLVTGVLSNYDVMVAKDTSYSFDEITYDMLSNFNFNSDCDAIGYNWKDYSFDLGSYTINSSINYILKDKQQKYFKLRFTDFYNSDGDKGYPTFELQEL